MNIAIGLMGGLSLFLYGMKMMSDGLEIAAGDRLQSILAKLTSNPLVGMLVGALVTGIIQSSSATTVMTVGFVNAGLMTLPQAVGVIMGANIGTTITGQLIALDIGAVAPIIALIGVVMVVFLKNRKINSYGMIAGGLGILFIGMNLMSDAMVPLRDMPEFINLITAFDNPLIAILTGAGFTALIQSSSASIGILQTLSMNGLIGIQHSVFILFGMNIGTCITAVLSCLSSNRNAKRVAIVHLMFNVLGTAIFASVCMLFPLATWIGSFTPTNPAAQIANFHTLFNIVTTLILLPFGSYLAIIATKILPDKQQDKPTELHIFQDNGLGKVSISLFELNEELNRMYSLIKTNLNEAFHALLTLEWDKNKILETEELLDQCHKQILDAVPYVTSSLMSVEESRRLTIMYKSNNDLERIGDHIVNLSEHATALLKERTVISPESIEELSALHKIILNTVNIMPEITEYEDTTILEQINQLEDDMDRYCEKSRQRQIARLKNKEIDGATCVIFSEILTDIERIQDHFHNLAVQLYHHGALME